ncbi:MAG: hypothetical protein ACKV0T_28680, partial [Planctomycetales bacterium]
RTDKPLPSELDRQVLLMFAALFEKSSAPENYLWQLQQFYQATHDFRLLAVTADAIQGRTAQRLYPFLGELRTTLTEVRDEATADRLVAHLTARRDQSDSPVDRRADDLLEALVERRAAELQNQPGPHVERAVAALRRAFRREWSPGEQRLMADLLSSLGAITAEPLAAEQLREMRELHDSQPAGTLDRLHICRRWSELTSYYGRPDRAIDQLAVGLAEYRTAHGGRLTPLANDALATWISFLVDQKHFVRAEQTLQDELAGATPTQQRLWLTQKLYDVYSEALQRDGTVSLGARDELFAAVEGRLLADLQTGDQNHRYQILTRLCNLYRVAHNIKLRRTAMALREFAAKAFPEALRRQTNNYQSLVMQVAGVIHDLLSPREALAFLLDRIDQEPPRFRYQNQDGWNTYGDTLAVWRTEAKELGDLQPRLLKIVLDALRKDLESQQRRHPRIYHRGYHEPDFWKAEADTFAKTADDVLVKFHGNNPIVQYVADYYWNGLNRPERAIEVLLVAHRDKELDENGRSRLIDWLHQTKRYGESIGLLQAMIEELPDRLQYRLWLMQALFHTNRRVELVALLEKTDADFHEKDRWTLGALAGLAETCLATQLYPQSLRYYEELIPKYRQAQPNGGLGDGTLSNYFANQARVHAALGQTAPAVEAASAAIVTWGPNREQRAAALTSLRAVVEQSPDLPAYIALLDRETQQTGQDRPIVRKTLGQVLLAKAQPQVALAQLQRAVEFQPNDPEIHQALVACFDALNDRAGAVNQLLLATTITPREWKLYDSLAERFTKLEQPREAERALTSIIDALPSEAESHSLLAEARQKQNQWKAAAEQWEQVVRIRSLEPTGFFNLAAAQIQAQQWDAAEATLKKLETTPWPGRFGNVPSQTQPLRQQWEQGRRK